MEKLRAYRLRRRIAVPLMLAFSVLWLGTMALLTASTQDRLDITVQRIYKDARDDLEERWSYYEANLENGLGAEAEHIMVDNLSSSSLALTDIAEGRHGICHTGRRKPCDSEPVGLGIWS